jgi:hypothetical protein
MIATASIARPLAVKQATLRPRTQRNVLVAVFSKHNDAFPPVLDRRRCVGDFVFHPELDIKNVS